MSNILILNQLANEVIGRTYQCKRLNITKPMRISWDVIKNYIEVTTEYWIGE